MLLIMKESGRDIHPVLLVGGNKLTYSIAFCLYSAGQRVILVTSDVAHARRYLALAAGHTEDFDSEQLIVTPNFDFHETISRAILVTEENLSVKKQQIARLEELLPKDTLIAVNTESISLADLQEGTSAPERILGANWVEPAHTTLFLEIISNEVTSKQLVDDLYQTARDIWKKDPYVIHGNSGVRTRLFAAMLREAFYLIKNGYANVEDIDRACRNDAGYYLPFAGNLRYMDLMGTYAYGMVMKDLNPELASDRIAPEFFEALVQQKRFGMESGSGFYEYQPGENEKWDVLMNKFSHQISGLIQRYPFNYKTAGQDLSPVHSENRL